MASLKQKEVVVAFLRALSDTDVEAVLGVKAMGVDAIMVTLGDMKGQACITTAVGQLDMAIGKHSATGADHTAMASHLGDGKFLTKGGRRSRGGTPSTKRSTRSP